MALGQPGTGFISHQIAVVELRRIKAQSSIQQKLPRRRLQQICAAHNFCDFHRVIVGYDRELICGHTASPPYYEVPEISACNVALPA